MSGTDRTHRKGGDNGGQREGRTLGGRTICATGRFMTTTHAGIARIVRDFGGNYARQPNRLTTWLVLGDDGWPARRDGRPTVSFEKARRLIARGYTIHFLSEAEFLDRLGLAGPGGLVRGLHTIGDLAGLFGVTAARVRVWRRAGLIEPVRTLHRLEFFDFHQVAAARRLCELLRAGVGLAAIRGGVEAVRGWTAADRLPLHQLDLLERDGRLLVRLNGMLFDPTGQRHFDFDSGPLAAGGEKPQETHETLRLWSAGPSESRLDELFDAALAAEDAGRWRRAAELYGELIALEPNNPVLHFNLGNVLAALKDVPSAADAFRRAVELDAGYAEAWNNLGGALVDLNRPAEASRAFRTARRLVPAFTQAVENLDRLLSQIRRTHALRIRRLD
jgi:DNA-binding transcriptional MerR regulator